MPKQKKYKEKKIQEKMNKQKIKENNEKLNLNWYPGHMAKTKRLIKEKYNLIDIVYEVIDARIPYSSKIKDIDDLLKNKKRILIMTKKDLCDLDITNKWVSKYENDGYKVLLVNLNENKVEEDIINLTHELTKDIQSKRKEKGLSQKEIRALVVGIPNVGKSTLINRMAGKKVTNIGNYPGVTKNLAWLKTNSDILLLDSPGILWPKLDNEEVALNLASLTAIPEEILPVGKVAVHILNKLDKYYPSILENRYNINNVNNDDIIETYDLIGKRIGAIVSGGNIDYTRVSNAILKDIKDERIKGITFDRIDD